MREKAYEQIDMKTNVYAIPYFIDGVMFETQISTYHSNGNHLTADTFDVRKEVKNGR